jgi:hypothetical protein
MKTKLLISILVFSVLVISACEKNTQKEISKKIISIEGKNIKYEQYESSEQPYLKLNEIIKSLASEDESPDELIVNSKLATPDIFEISVAYEYSGGAHPVSGTSYSYFRKEPFKKIGYSDIFIESFAQKIATVILENHIKKSLPEEKECLKALDTNSVMESLKSSNFSLDAKAIHIELNVSRACSPESTTDTLWVDLNLFLTPEFKEDLSNFKK